MEIKPVYVSDSKFGRRFDITDTDDATSIRMKSNDAVKYAKGLAAMGIPFVLVTNDHYMSGKRWLNGV